MRYLFPTLYRIFKYQFATLFKINPLGMPWSLQTRKSTHVPKSLLLLIPTFCKIVPTSFIPAIKQKWSPLRYDLDRLIFQHFSHFLLVWFAHLLSVVVRDKGEMQSASILSFYSCGDSFCDFYTCVASALLLQFLGTVSHGLIRKFQGVYCGFSLGENPM